MRGDGKGGVFFEERKNAFRQGTSTSLTHPIFAQLLDLSSLSQAVKRAKISFIIFHSLFTL